MYNLQGKNYVFSVMPTYKHILAEACVAVASKTKKNILISIQARYVLLLSAESEAKCRSWVHCRPTCASRILHGVGVHLVQCV